MKTNVKHPAFMAFILGLFIPVISGAAATLTWTNIIGGNWNGAANWSPNAVPGSTDTALITQAGNYIVEKCSHFGNNMSSAKSA